MGLCVFCGLLLLSSQVYGQGSYADNGADVHHHHYSYYGNVYNQPTLETPPLARAPHPEHHHPKDEGDSRVYRFQVGDNFGAYEYIDVDGHLKGFHPDLIHAVCKEAGRTCFWVYDVYTNCWSTAGGVETPGQGLMAGWYDGCVGLFPTPERMNSFNFSLPFTKDFRAALYYRAKEAPVLTQANLTGMTIGFVDGWAVGRSCLARQLEIEGSYPGSYTHRMYDTHQDMVVALVTGEVDVILTVDAFTEVQLQRLNMARGSHFFKCTKAGASMMARLGDGIVPWWNEAFGRMRENGAYRDLCNKAKETHGVHGNLWCLDD